MDLFILVYNNILLRHLPILIVIPSFLNVSPIMLSSDIIIAVDRDTEETPVMFSTNSFLGRLL